MKRYRPTGFFEPAKAVSTTPVNFCERDMVAEIAPIDGSHWRLCLHPLHFRRSQNPDLTELLNNSAARNPLFNPAFVNAGRDRVIGGKIFQLAVWEIIDGIAKPRMAIPVSEQPGKIWRQPMLHSLTHPYAPLGDPLVHAGSGAGGRTSEEIAERFLELAANAFEEGMATLLLDHLPANAPLTMVLKKQAKKNQSGDQLRGKSDSLCVSVKPLGSRAVISGPDSDPLGSINKKRLREFRRLEKKLTQTGAVTYTITSDPMEILIRLEEFLLLEARGWKGRQGTSIHNLKRHAAFARQAIYDLSRTSQAEIATLRLNDVAVASTLIISQNGFYYPWKTAFNETLSRYSPGTLLMVWLTRELAGRKGFKGADSLAKYGKSWMTNLWSEKREFCTAVIAADCDRADAIQENLSKTQRLKTAAKKLLGRD